MAHTDACKIQVTQFVKKLTDGGLSIRQACEEAQKESDGIPAGTIRRWWQEIMGQAAERFIFEPVAVNPSNDIENPKKQAIQAVTNESPGPGRKAKYNAEKAMFNRTNDNIEWAKWTWNPVTGCNHGCPYCYAKDIAARFYPPKIGFKPHFYPNRIDAPQNMPTPSRNCQIGERNVFAVSMGDLFGEWVPQDWIDQILGAIEMSPEWNFLFLTKNPQRYLKIKWPANAWVGATVDCQDRVELTEKVFGKIEATVKFISCEPLLEPLQFKDLRIIDWIIIGGQSQPGATQPLQPNWEWVESLLSQARKAECKVYFKPNLTVRPREFPSLGEGNE